MPPRKSLDNSTSPRGGRGGSRAANAFANALVASDGDDGDETPIRGPKKPAPQRTWRESTDSDSDSDYEGVEAYEGPSGPSRAPRVSFDSPDGVVRRPRKPDAFDTVANGVGRVTRGLWRGTLIGPLVARNVFLLDPDDAASDSGSGTDDDGNDGVHGVITRARKRHTAGGDVNTMRNGFNVRTTETVAAETMRSVFGVATRAARAVSPFASKAPPARKTLRRSLPDGKQVGGGARSLGTEFGAKDDDGNNSGYHSLRAEKTFFKTSARKQKSDRLLAVSSTLAGLREELKRELEDENAAKLVEHAKAERSAARVAQRAWAKSKATWVETKRIGRDLLTRKEQREPARGAGSITVRVRHLHSLVGTYIAVHVCNGEDLLPMDLGNTSDPYVNLWLENADGEKITELGCVSSVSYRERTLNPVWNETVFMGSASLAIDDCTLHLQVMDFDVIGADDDMGSCEIPLRVFKRHDAIGRANSGYLKRATSIFYSPQKGSESTPVRGGKHGKSSSEVPVVDHRSFVKPKDPAVTLRDFLAHGGGSHTGVVEGSHGQPHGSNLQSTFQAHHGGESPETAFETYCFLDLNDDLEGEDLNDLKKVNSLQQSDSKKPAKKPARATSQIGTYRWICHGWIQCELRLTPPDTEATVRREAMAMLGYATHVLDPRNVVKSLSSSGAGSWLSQKIDAAVQSGKRKAIVVFDDAIDKSRLLIVQKVVSDRDMPATLQKYIGAAVNLYLTDAQRELMDIVGLQLGLHAKGKGGRRRASRRDRGVHRGKPTVLTKSFEILRGVRAWILYVEVPYDKTIFGKMRVPAWWVFTFMKLYSGWGVQSALFLLKLLLIDRSDEWQLFLFIVQFKGIQFFSGLVAILLGVLQYVGCAGTVDKGQPHTCHVHGPGVDGESACSYLPFSPCVALVVFSASSRILLSWFAFYLIKRAFSFGKQILGEHRIVGAKIEVHQIVPGNPNSLAWNLFGKPVAVVKRCLKHFSPAYRREQTRIQNDPLLRFKKVAETVIAANRKAHGHDSNSLLFDGKFHIVRRKAKIVSYDDAADRHTIVFKDDSENVKKVVDLDALIFSVIRMKHMNPRRFQSLLNTYDVLVFFLSAIITIWYAAAIDYDGGEQWKLFALIFWTQSFYSLFAFPFVLTVIPGVQRMICTARPTGYDRNGRLHATLKRQHFNDDGQNEPEPRSKYVPACYPIWR